MLRWPINLLPDGSVVTNDGEVLGTWEGDDIRSFTPEGASEPLFFHPFIPDLAKMIEKWRQRHESLGYAAPG